MSDGPLPCGPCPSRDALVAHALGEQAAGPTGPVAAHLAVCPDCAAAVRGIVAAGETGTHQGAGHERADLGAPTPVPQPSATPAAGLPLSPDPPALAAAPEASPPPPAQIGQYRIAGRLGRGGMGEVYKAQHLRLKKWVAVKLLPPGRVADGRAVARFQREMEVVGRLDHPNLVRAMDAGEADGAHFLVMELVIGLDLARVVRRRGPLPPAEACELIRQAAIGLQHAHENNLVHRDLKPSNLILSAAGVVKILDLGLALLRDDRAAENLTAEGHLMGTADYMAPEQWEACHTVDIRADIYSLGCTLYMLLTGQPPFAGPEYGPLLRKMAAHATAVPRPITDFRSDVPAALPALLGRMLAKAPAGRPGSPAALADELQPLAAGADLARLCAALMPAESETGSDLLFIPTAPPTPGSRDRTVTVGRSRRWPWVVGGAVVAAAVGVAVVSGLLPWRLTAPLPEQSAGTAQVGTPPVETERVPPELPGPPPAPSPVRGLGPGRWHDLLDRPPTKLVWHDPAGDSLAAYDPDKRTVNVHCFAAALLGLGRTDAPRYQFRVGVRQTRWAGYCGIFFGARPYGKPGELRCHVIRLRANVGARQDFGLYRCDGFVRLRPGGPPEVETPDLVRAALPAPGPREYVLEVTVGDAGLVKVSWDGQPCPAVAENPVNAKFSPGDYRGEFGIFCQGSAVSILSAQFMALE